MKLGVYSIYSTLSELYAGDGLFMYRTDAQASYILGQKIPAEEKANCKLVKVAEFDIESGSVYPIDPVTFAWVSNVDDFSVKSPISHESHDVQVSKFAERISDV